MVFNPFTGVSNFQAALSGRLAQLSQTLASGVLERVNALPHWQSAVVERPTTLGDLARPLVAFHFMMNPTFGGAICRVLRLDPRSVYRREIRADRLLPLRDTLPLTLTDHIHSVPAAKIVLLLQKHPKVRLFIARENRAEARLTASIIGILLMGIKQGENVTFRAEGEGAAEVLRQIRKYNAAEWFNGDRRRSRVDFRDIQGTDVGGIVRQVLEVMREFEEDELAAIYHPETRRLIVGHILSTHREIAKSAGFGDSDSYLRLNLDARGGRLQACFGPGKDEESKEGRDQLQVWLAELFRGVNVPPF
ncbi:MAG TPA: HPr family phosphocarrier protein [bacterium]|nr:HPr family phosphocarrier protein [bacterium]